MHATLRWMRIMPMGEESRPISNKDGEWTKDLSTGAMQQAQEFKKRKDRERQEWDAMESASCFNGHTFDEHLQQTFRNWHYGKCIGCSQLVEDPKLDHACCTCKGCKDKGDRKVICGICYRTHIEESRSALRRRRRR